jgi:hypothetical protein
MRVVLFVILLSCASCVIHTEDVPVPCGYDDIPYQHVPSSCNPNPWSYSGGDCCTWTVDEFYSECIETWCHNEHLCKWQVIHYSCYPI